MLLYILHWILKLISSKCKQVIYSSQGIFDVLMKRHGNITFKRSHFDIITNSAHMNGQIPNHAHSLYPPSMSDQNDYIATLGHRHLADHHSLEARFI